MRTAQDVVDYLLASIGGGAQDGEHRAVRQAVVHGVREVMQCRQWLWHTRTNHFATLNVTTAVATNGITQGSTSIAVTNSSQLVPGRLIQCGNFFDEPCRIVSVLPGSVVVDLPAKASIAPGSTETLTMQTFYDLPADLKDIDSLVSHTVGTLHCYLAPHEWQRLDVHTKGSGEPYYYTVMRSDSNPDRYQIRFVGMPTNGTVMHYTYRYIPKPIKYMGYERSCRQGTVSSTDVNVIGSNTAFPEDVAGSVIRFGTTTTEADPIGSLSPFTSERQIVSRGTGTALVVDTPIVLPALTKYAISDPIDSSPQMYTAILSSCEMWYSRIAGKPADAAMQLYNRDLRIAMENDEVSPLSGRPITARRPTPLTMGWHSTLRGDVE